MEQDFGPSCIVEFGGRRWTRPNSSCYACDVNGPGCRWHGQDWVEDPDGQARSD
jgi:hypothetical protein